MKQEPVKQKKNKGDRLLENDEKIKNGDNT
jgi:hypothetical protein